MASIAVPDKPRTIRPRAHRRLAERFAAGDPRAVRDAYETYGGAILTVTRQRLRDPRLAEEAVQDTFLKAWRASSTFDPARDLRPWLYEIARRAASDIARREARRPRTAPLATADPPADAPPFDHAWEAWQVRLALGRLPPGERELVRLTHFVGLSQSQIAARLDQPLGTVKSRVLRAHARLADHLSHLREARDRS